MQGRGKARVCRAREIPLPPRVIDKELTGIPYSLDIASLRALIYLYTPLL
jgi:hypothetical protein